jgi:hypothetical protein
MKMTWQKVFVGGLAASLGACGALDDTDEGTADPVDEVAAVIAEAEVAFGALEEENEACFQQFRTCREGVERGSAEARACLEALRACLPERPGRPEGRPDGGMRPDRPRPGRPHPPGGQRPGRHADGGARPDHGDGGPGHGRGMGRGHVGPIRRHLEPEAVKACREQLHTCLDGDAEREVCVDQARTCVRAALVAAFESLCEDARERCAMAGASDRRCERIEERCEAGFPPPRR